MISTSIRSLNALCIVGYLLFMGLAIDSRVVDAVVFSVSEKDGQLALHAGKIQLKPLAGKSGVSRPVALQYRSQAVASSPIAARTAPLVGVPPRDPSAGLGRSQESVASMTRILTNLRQTMHRAREESTTIVPAPATVLPQTQVAGKAVAPVSSPVAAQAPAAGVAADQSGRARLDSSRVVDVFKNIQGVTPMAAVAPAQGGTLPAQGAIEVSLPQVAESTTDEAVNAAPRTVDNKSLSILSLIRSLPDKPWAYDPQLDRYVVRYDQDTTLVLTLRPSLQRLAESVFQQYSCKMGSAIIQDPLSGAILAMTSFDGRSILSPMGGDFVGNNWALKPTFPVASLFKIITAAAAIEKKGAVPHTRVHLGRKWVMELWKGFAISHNGVFGVVGRAVGRTVLQGYADAFGFNRPFYFDLPVQNSVARLPDSAGPLGQAAAGLNKNFEISPVHVSSIISTVLNRGKLMKPFLVESVIHRGQTVFRRKAFQLSQPITQDTASKIYEMMRYTTTQGTGKKGFHGYEDCPELADLCGGKTGTLTGLNPKLLFTWFGGFTRAGGRDLSLVVLCGQQGTNRIKATTLAGRISYQLLNGRTHPATPAGEATTVAQGQGTVENHTRASAP